MPGTSITANGYELFGYVRFVPAGEDGDPSDFSAHVDFTDETAERNPDWKLDLCDEVIGSWRGHAGRSPYLYQLIGEPASIVTRFNTFGGKTLKPVIQRLPFEQFLAREAHQHARLSPSSFRLLAASTARCSSEPVPIRMTSTLPTSGSETIYAPFSRSFALSAVCRSIEGIFCRVRANKVGPPRFFRATAQATAVSAASAGRIKVIPGMALIDVRCSMGSESGRLLREIYCHAYKQNTTCRPCIEARRRVGRM